MNIVATFMTLLLTYFKPKLVDYLLQNQSSKCLEKSKFGQFCFKIDQNHNFIESINFGFQGAKRSLMNGATTFFNSFHQNSRF